MKKICPQCRSVYTDDNFFCLNDGTRLQDDDEQETLVNKKPDFSAQTLALPQMPAAPTQAAATQTDEPRPAPQPPKPTEIFSPVFTPPNTQASTSKTSSNRNLLLVIAALAVVIVVGIILLLAIRPHPAAAKLDKAIAENKLIAPAGESAYDFYRELKKDGGDAKVLQKFEERLFPLLTEKPQEILKTVIEPGITEKNLNDWQDAAKMLEWASEMRPADSQLAAKAAYCKGRVNYLKEDRLAAIEDWKKAAELDKRSALALNGIGLAYNELKNYDTARTWLRQAIDREPNWALPYNNYGTSFYYQKNYSEALQYYQKAVDIAPRWARVHSWIASVAAKTGDYATCVKELEFVLSPEAIGASQLKLDEIRKAKQNCENKANQYYYEY